MTDELGAFRLLGTPADETRTLVHQTGFRASLPGHPILEPGSSVAPISHVGVQLQGLPVHVNYRVDRISTQLEMETLAVGLATAYAISRSAREPFVRALGNEELCDGSEAGARSIYGLPDSETTEWVSVLVQSVTPTDVDIVYQTVSFKRADLNVVHFATLRTAMIAAQRWDASDTSPIRFWPTNGFWKPSASLELSEMASAEAQAKAAELPDVDQDDIAALTDMLIGFANTDHAPEKPTPKFFLDAVAAQVAAATDTRVSLVLLRNLYDVENMHELRGWCWQCLWALGNRRPLRAS